MEWLASLKTAFISSLRNIGTRRRSKVRSRLNRAITVANREKYQTKEIELCAPKPDGGDFWYIAIVTIDPRIDAVYISKQFFSKLGIPEESIDSGATGSQIVVDGEKSGSAGSVHLSWRPYGRLDSPESTKTALFEITTHPDPPFDILCGPSFLDGQ